MAGKFSGENHKPAICCGPKELSSTVAGNISSSWEKSAGSHFSLKINVPKGTAAGVYLPTPDLNSVKINGEKLTQESEIKPRLEGDKWVVLTVNAGDYQFECEMKE